MAATNDYREQARAVVREVSRSHGSLEEEILVQIPPAGRAVVENAPDVKDRKISASITTLAKTLCNSKARFVFELIQNAEDCHYTQANKRGETPFISFKVYPDRITIECNQDEFKDENVRALCNIGESSKTGMPGYVGEKGIGFKSVFMVASKVSIQSGPFSFYFKHNIGDLGMGMIHPIWEEHLDENRDKNSTRITLILRNRGESSDPFNEQGATCQYFKGLENTTLLFLKKLKRIAVSFYDGDDAFLSSTTYSSQYDEVRHTAILVKTCCKDGAMPKDEREYYYVIKRLIHGLPKHDHRKYTENNDNERVDATSEVVLAFQVNDNFEPVIKNQKVSAFLPIGEAGFRFLIQSDFVTRADREGVVEDSARNIALLDGIAKTFIDAAEQMCNDKTLQYTWMKYLPNNELTGTFWPKLMAKIKLGLSSVDTKVLRTHRDGRLKSIGQVKLIPSYFTDRHHEPLFEDLQEEVYIADGYAPQDLTALYECGLAIMDYNSALVRVHADLESRNSRMKDPNTDNHWHSSAATFLSLPFTREWNAALKSAVQALPIVPLKNGHWVSVNDVKGRVCYPCVNNVLIPNDLPSLYILGVEPDEGSERWKLFNYLGVTIALASEVRNLIIQKCENNDKVSLYKPDRESSLAHLEFLFYTNEPGTAKIPGLSVYDSENNLRIPSSHCVYFKTNERYGAFKLLEKSMSPKENFEAPRFEAPFLHPMYLESTRIRRSGPLSWKLWLQNYVGVQKFIPLTVHKWSGEEFSKAFKYVLHNEPKMVLGVLRFGWSHYSKNLTGTAEELLSNAEILCEDTRKEPFRKIYLPMPILKQRCARFLTYDETFPFVQIPLNSRHESCTVWAFLTRFGIGMFENLDFYLSILDRILENNPMASKVSCSLRIFQLYEAILSQCWGSEEMESQIETVRAYFRDKRAIYVPGRESIEAIWAYPQDCRWNAPANFESKHTIDSLYMKNIARSDTDAVTLKKFFQNTLNICDVTWRDLFLELSAIRSSGQKQLSRVQDLYRLLNDMRKTLKSSEADQIRDTFRSSKNIYIDSKNSWYTTEDCIWSSAVEITVRTTISYDYGVFEDFFVKFLGVETPNVSMLLDELIGLGNRRAPTDKVKAVIWAINSLVKSDDKPPKQENWKDANILPVIMKGGSTELQNSKSKFSVINRQKLADAFGGKTAMLDFNLTEVKNLQPFLKWLDLEKRYLSRTVREVSRLDGALATPVSNTDQVLCLKAQALFRCAVHFESPRVRNNDFSLYRLFCHAKVYQTDNIYRNFYLEENDGTITESVPSKSRLYIDEKGTELLIYIPRDARERELCYLGTLPQRILDLIMTNPITLQLSSVEPSAITVIGSVLKSSSYVVNDLLEEAGVIPLNIPMDEQPFEESSVEEDFPCSRRCSVPHDSSSSSGSWRKSSSGSRRPKSRTPRSTSSSSKSSPGTTPSPSRTCHSPRPHASCVAPTSLISAFRPEFGEMQHLSTSVLSSTDQYERLLDKIIRESQTAIFPTQCAFNLSILGDALPRIARSKSHEFTEYPSAFGDRSANQIEHDRKEGAAGELFVFEILSRLFPTLPGMVDEAAFSQANWESKIRKYVTVHQKYAEMEAWSGKHETSDITYDDKIGIFTRFLRGKGYLQPEIWKNATLMYYIEVKAATNECDTQLFVSNGQYKRMYDCHNSNAKMVYIIIRVFNLDKDNINMRIYVDPVAMEQRHELNFTAAKWTVVPGKGDSDAIVSQDG